MPDTMPTETPIPIPPTNTPAPPPPVSQQEYLALMNRALDDLIRRLEPREHAPVSFSANLFLAHEVAIRRMPLDVLLEMVDALAKRDLRRLVRLLLPDELRHLA